MYTAVIERDLQYINFSFGAALGGYIGIVISTKNLPQESIFNLMILLGAAAGWLSQFHETALAVVKNGFKKNVWFLNLSLIAVVVLQFLSAMVGEVYGAAFRIFGAWNFFLFLNLFLVSYRIRRQNR